MALNNIFKNVQRKKFKDGGYIDQRGGGSPRGRTRARYPRLRLADENTAASSELIHRGATRISLSTTKSA